MYDTIHLWYDGHGGNDLMNDVPSLLTSVSSEGINLHTGSNYVTGHLNNLKVMVSDSGLSLKGSLPKYYLNDNCQVLNRQDTERTIEKISDILHLSIKNGKITRLDIGHNIILNYAIESYFNVFGDGRYYHRIQQPKSLYYQNTKRQLVFYDKIQEVKSKHGVLPEIWKDKNVLRYEMRLNKRIDKQLNCKQVTAQSLFDENFYMKVVNRWFNEYQEIQKINDFDFNYKVMKTPNDVWTQLTALMIQKEGANFILELIETLKKKEVFERPEYYSRLKKDLKKYTTNKDFTQESESIIELNKKMKSVKRFYR